jgi:hypothetical protein
LLLRVLQPVLALLAIVAVAWVVAGFLIRPPETAQTPRQNVTVPDAAEQAPEPEVEIRNVEDYSSYDVKDPFRELIPLRQEEDEDTAPDDTDDTDGTPAPDDPSATPDDDFLDDPTTTPGTPAPDPTLGTPAPDPTTPGATTPDPLAPPDATTPGTPAPDPTAPGGAPPPATTPDGLYDSGGDLPVRPPDEASRAEGGDSFRRAERFFRGEAVVFGGEGDGAWIEVRGERLTAGSVLFGTEVVRVDPEERVVVLSRGNKLVMYTFSERER